jgi:hypothetical protein
MQNLTDTILEGLKWLLNLLKEQVYIFIGKGLGLPLHKGSNPPNTRSP